MNLNTIVFDLGGVLIDWDPRHLYNKIFDTPEQIEDFLENICTTEWNSLQDAGRSLQEATDILIEQHPEYRHEIAAYYGRWQEMLNGHIEGTLQILKDLKAGGFYDLLALTNWSGETFPVALNKFEFLHWFKGIVVSGDEKLKKPDPRIYEILFDRYNINPRQSVFIDDSYPNIEMAKKLGMHTVHFQGPDLLNRELQAMGIRFS